ncbi:hypothetical protein CJ030_MR7G000025 [Morella rubra]|uniref:Uncharacterized protein n=1 Tax=Morella rubra TaxID=262757 RepID=A0A6A1V1G3_9ROSI|nr:hypothetical protein CJ030_MR7G000025 [Morella rubra]
MENLRGQPVAKERPMTLIDFDHLLYEEHSLYQLFEYQGFLHQLLRVEGFCVVTLVHDFLCALVSVDRAPERGVTIGDRETHKEKRSEQNKKNISKLTVNHAASSRSFQLTQPCMILGKKLGYVRGLGRAVKPPPSSTLTTQSSDLQHQLAKARDEIEAMRAAREKDLQEFVKKQAEMEATLRDHREEQRVEQERIRLEQEERMKREQEHM